MIASILTGFGAGKKDQRHDSVRQNCGLLPAPAEGLAQRGVQEGFRRIVRAPPATRWALPAASGRTIF